METQTSQKMNAPTQDYKKAMDGAQSTFTAEAGNALNKAKDMGSDLAEIGSQYYKIGTGYAKENPAQAIGIAVGVGFIAGSLFTLALSRRA